MNVQIRRGGALWLVAAAPFGALLGCGRGPVEPPPPIVSAHTITFQFYVNGQITPSQGNYVIAVNANIDPSTNVNATAGEQPGEPIAQEAQGSPATYTHWDQEFVYGSSSLAQPNSFLYQYKVLTGGTSGTSVALLPIVLTTNDFTLVTNASVGTGSGNVLSITLPIADLSIRGNPSSSTPPTITTPAVTQIYVNYITTDTSGIPQDQLGANGLATIGFTQIVDITTAATIQLPNFSGVAGPSNPNLFISGGLIIVQP